jgi:hypothetical protein
MARPFSFESLVADGLHTYRYVEREGPIVERNWPGLFGEWPSEGPNPYTEYAVNNNNCEELAVYLAFIWRLMEGLVPYGVPRYHRDDAAYAAGAPYGLVMWEYEVDDDGRNPGQIRGFVPARSSVRIFPPAGPWQLEHEREAGFFELPVFEVLRDVVKALLADASAELNIYALEQWNATTVVKALRTKDPPRLDDVLGRNEMFIDLLVGVDEGYRDVLVVQSKRDLAHEIHSLTREYEEAITRYEERVDDIAGNEQFFENMRELLNLGVDGELSRFGAI